MVRKCEALTILCVTLVFYYKTLKKSSLFLAAILLLVVAIGVLNRAYSSSGSGRLDIMAAASASSAVITSRHTGKAPDEALRSIQ